MADLGSTQFDPIPIGEIVNPPFVRLPDPSTMFARRAERLRSLADAHQLRAYLTFVADLSDVQHRLQSALPPPGPPSSADLTRARQFKMPPLDQSRFTRDAPFDELWDQLLAMVEQIAMPENANLALQRLRLSDAPAQAAVIAGVLDGTMPAAAPCRARLCCSRGASSFRTACGPARRHDASAYRRWYLPSVRLAAGV